MVKRRATRPPKYTCVCSVLNDPKTFPKRFDSVTIWFRLYIFFLIYFPSVLYVVQSWLIGALQKYFHSLEMSLPCSIYLNFSCEMLPQLILSLPRTCRLLSLSSDTNYKGTSKSFKLCENIIRVSNSLDSGRTPSYSVSHPDPNCLHMGLWSRSVG